MIKPDVPELLSQALCRRPEDKSIFPDMRNEEIFGYYGLIFLTEAAIIVISCCLFLHNMQHCG